MPIKFTTPGTATRQITEEIAVTDASIISITLANPPRGMGVKTIAVQWVKYYLNAEGDEQYVEKDSYLIEGQDAKDIFRAQVSGGVRRELERLVHAHLISIGKLSTGEES